MPRRNEGSDFSSFKDADDIIRTVYGDLISFLMVFFVLLFVLSNHDKPKKMFTEYQVKRGEQQYEAPDVMTSEYLFVSQIQNFIKKEKLTNQVKVLVNEQKVRIILGDPILFDSGKADLKAYSKKILSDFSKVFAQVKNPIIIEGYTDNVPIDTDKFSSNWELSFYRSFAVLKYFVNVLGFRPDQLSCLGYGEYRPIVSNDTAKNRRKNRRIEINVIRITESKTKK